MSLAKSIAKNTLIHTIGKFSGSAIGIVIVALLTRYLGTEGYGHFATIMAYLFFFATLGDLGLYLVTVNELGREDVNQKKLFSNIFTMRLISGLVLMLLANGLIWFFPYPYLVKIGTLFYSLCVFLMMIDQVTVAVFQEKMKTKYVALAEVVGKIVILLLVFLTIKMNLGFIYILGCFILGLIVHFIINIFYARKFLPFKCSFDKEVWQAILSKSWPIATYMIFSMLYFKADTIILSLYHSQSVVGLYGAPYKILEVLIAFPAIFMGLVSPHLSRAFSVNNLVGFKKIFQKAFDFLSIIIWPMIFGVTVLAKPIMNLIAGQEFLPSVPILKILIIATGIIFITHLSTFSIVTIGKQKQMMKYYIFAAVLALVLYFVFIPRYSYWAAATITVLVEFFILAASWLMVKKETKIKISFSNFWKGFLVSTLMALILSLTRFNLFVSIILGGIIYIGGLWFLGLLKKEMLIEFTKNKEAR